MVHEKEITLKEVLSYTVLDQSFQVVAKITLTHEEHEAIFRDLMKLTFLGAEIQLNAVQVQEAHVLLNFQVSSHLLQDY